MDTDRIPDKMSAAESPRKMAVIGRGRRDELLTKYVMALETVDRLERLSETVAEKLEVSRSHVRILTAEMIQQMNPERR